jgi:cytochrome c556
MHDLLRQWERRLRDDGLAAVELGERYYDASGRQRRVASVDHQMASLNDSDSYQAIPLFSGDHIWDRLAQFKALVPAHIRDIAELDHRRRSRRQNEALQRWIEEVGLKLAAKLGLH